LSGILIAHFSNDSQSIMLTALGYRAPQLDHKQLGNCKFFSCST